MKNYNVLRTVSGVAGLAGLAAGGFALANTVEVSHLEQGQGVYQMDGTGPGYVAVEGTSITYRDGQPYGTFEPVETAIADHKQRAKEMLGTAVTFEGAMLAGLWKARRMKRRQEEQDTAAEMQQLWDTRHED